MFSAKIYHPDSRNSVISPQATKIATQGVTWSDIMGTWDKSLLFLNWKIYIQRNSRKSTKQHKGQWPRSGAVQLSWCSISVPWQSRGIAARQWWVTPLFLIKCIVTKPLNSLCPRRESVWSVQQPHSEVLPSGRQFMASQTQRTFAFLSHVLGNKGTQEIRDAARGSAGISVWAACTPTGTGSRIRFSKIWSISKSLYSKYNPQTFLRKPERKYNDFWDFHWNILEKTRVPSCDWLKIINGWVQCVNHW